MSDSLGGKVAIVTGGSQGIGNAIARGLAAEGARIVVADVQRAEEAAQEFEDGVGLAVDVADEKDVERMAAEAVERCGRIDILVNNAGLYAALRDVSVSARTLKRDQTPDDVVGAVVFLAGPCASFVTGQTMVIDGGQYFH